MQTIINILFFATRWQNETLQQRRWRGWAVFLTIPLTLTLDIFLIIIS